MSEFVSILPPNQTRAVRALEAGIATGKPDLVPVSHLTNPDTCPPHLLGWLAWALSVDVWRDEWSDDDKRETIRTSIRTHRRKGTVGAVRQMIRAAGLGEVEIIETYAQRYDGTFAYDGSRTYAGDDHWAEYRVVAARAVTIDQAALLRALLRYVAPARSRLKALDFRQAAHRYNGAIRYDGTFSYGVA